MLGMRAKGHFGNACTPRNGRVHPIPAAGATGQPGSTGKSESAGEKKIQGRAERQGRAEGEREIKGNAAGEKAKSTAPEIPAKLLCS